MGAITLRGIAHNMGIQILDVPAFPQRAFGGSFPEAIGDSSRSFWFGTIHPEWTYEDGRMIGRGSQPGELEYTVTFTASDETVDIVTEVTNSSDRPWKQSHAFNCFSPIGVPEVRDHDCVRHWVGSRGRLLPLLKVPRRFGPRPTIQLYAVEGGPRWQDIPFVANFHCSPDAVHLEPWLAIESKDRQRVVAIASKPCLYLFQNMEYSCIHAAASFSALGPGQSNRAFTRLWFVRQDIRTWYQRMKKEMAEVVV